MGYHQLYLLLLSPALWRCSWQNLSTHILTMYGRVDMYWMPIHRCSPHLHERRSGRMVAGLRIGTTLEICAMPCSSMIWWVLIENILLGIWCYSAYFKSQTQLIIPPKSFLYLLRLLSSLEYPMSVLLLFMVTRDINMTTYWLDMNLPLCCTRTKTLIISRLIWAYAMMWSSRVIAMQKLSMTLSQRLMTLRISQPV